MTIHRPIAATTLFSAGLACLSPALAADDDLKSLAERYFRNPFFSNLSISPDGSHFAFYQYRKIPGNQFFEYQRTISTFSVKTNEVRTFVGLDLWGVEAYDWVDDDNLIFQFAEILEYSIGRAEVATLGTPAFRNPITES